MIKKDVLLKSKCFWIKKYVWSKEMLKKIEQKQPCKGTSAILKKKESTEQTKLSSTQVCMYESKLLKIISACL